MCIGLIFVSAYNYLTAMLRALGDSKSPLYFLIVSAIINVCLDIIFVYFFKLGIKGAALATIISQFIAAASCAVYAYKVNPYFRLEKKDIVFVPGLAYKVIHLGVPMSLQFALIAISSMAVQRIVNSYGTAVVAAFTATNRIEQLIHQPYATLGASIATFCGQNYGAGRFTIPILITQYIGMGEMGIWLSTGIVWVLSGFTAWLRLISQRNVSFSVVKNA